MSDSTSTSSGSKTASKASAPQQLAGNYTWAAAKDAGFWGFSPDTEPNSNYTVVGQATRVPPPGQPGGPGLVWNPYPPVADAGP